MCIIVNLYRLAPLPDQEGCEPTFSFRKLPKTGQPLYFPESEVEQSPALF